MDTRNELTQEELDAQSGEQLPEREAMSIIDPSAGAMPPVPVDEVDPGSTVHTGDPAHDIVLDEGNNAA